jgi:hypothetical protein
LPCPLLPWIELDVDLVLELALELDGGPANELAIKLVIELFIKLSMSSS